MSDSSVSARATDQTAGLVERHRQGQVDYTDPALIARLRHPDTKRPTKSGDAALLEKRFSLARLVRLYKTPGSEAARYARDVALAELDACEAECRVRGLIG
jgi:hypothetical protein